MFSLLCTKVHHTLRTFRKTCFPELPSAVSYRKTHCCPLRQLFQKIFKKNMKIQMDKSLFIKDDMPFSTKITKLNIPLRTYTEHKKIK